MPALDAEDGAAARERLKDLAAHAVLVRLRRLSYARTSVLFSALAVEAVANYYIAIVLTKRDAEAIEQLNAPDKLLIAPEVGDHRRLFSPGREPMGTVARLFQARNRIVHPKPGNRSVSRVGDPDFDPARVADMLIAAATVQVRVFEALGARSTYDGTSAARRILDVKADLRKVAKRWANPPKTSSALAKLLEQRPSIATTAGTNTATLSWTRDGETWTQVVHPALASEALGENDTGEPPK